jgi:signal transduction histidine kinase
MSDDRCRGPHPPWRTNRDWRRHGFDPRARARFFRRAGAGAFALFMLAMSGIVVGALRLAERFNLAGTGPVVFPVLVLVAVFVLTAMLRRVTGFARQLREVMDAADRVADGDYAVRVTESGPPPVRALAQSFNMMTVRLADADRLRRNLMADVAHELRTPLSVLQGRLEGLVDGVYPKDDTQLAQLLEETHVLSRLVDDLRTLALSDAGALPLQKESTDIVALTQGVLRSLNGGGAALHGPEGRVILADVDPLRIREVLTNLLSNALRHTPKEGRVSVRVDERPDRVVVSVQDTGHGIPPEDLERLFERFYKGAKSRGSGLGLAIARGIVAAHGGEIHASSKVGEGTTIDFTVPR